MTPESTSQPRLKFLERTRGLEMGTAIFARPEAASEQEVPLATRPVARRRCEPARVFFAN